MGCCSLYPQPICKDISIKTRLVIFIQPALGLLLADGALTVHNVYFVKYDVTVSFLAQVLDTVTYCVSHVFDSGYSDIFWHILYWIQ